MTLKDLTDKLEVLDEGRVRFSARTWVHSWGCTKASEKDDHRRSSLRRCSQTERTSAAARCDWL